MQTTVIRRSTAPIALATTLLAAFLLLFAPPSASAHDDLVSSSPAADTTVDVLPTELVLNFSAEVISGDGATAVTVTDANGASVTDGAAVTAGASVTQPLLAEAEAGAYQVVWKVVSSDGHPTDGSFSFTVANSTVPASTPATTPSPSPSAVDTSAAEPAVTIGPEAPITEPEEDSPATAWIWILAAAGIVVVAGGIVTAVALTRRARRSTSPTDSDSPAAR